MSSNSIDLIFADGEYSFALPLPQINELQIKCGAGIGAIFSRVMRGAIREGDKLMLVPGQAEFYALDVIETVRQGLIGGRKGEVDGKVVEVTPPTARRLIDAYVMNQPLTYAWELAVAILAATIVGYDPPSKKAEAAAEQTPADASTTL